MGGFYTLLVGLVLSPLAARPEDVVGGALAAHLDQYPLLDQIGKISA
jgi:hypothetical protein